MSETAAPPGALHEQIEHLVKQLTWASIQLSRMAEDKRGFNCGYEQGYADGLLAGKIEGRKSK